MKGVSNTSNVNTANKGPGYNPYELGKRGRADDCEEQEEKLPMEVTILLRKFLSRHEGEDLLLGFALYNGYTVREECERNFGRPACGYVKFEDLRLDDRHELILRADEVAFKTTNADTPNSLASSLLISDQERVHFNLEFASNQGFQFVSGVGLEFVPTSNWARREPNLTVLTMSGGERAIKMQESYNRAKTDLGAFCASSQHPPYKTLGRNTVRFVLRKQTRFISQAQAPKFCRVLGVSKWVTSRIPAHPNSVPVQEDKTDD